MGVAARWRIRWSLAVVLTVCVSYLAAPHAALADEGGPSACSEGLLPVEIGPGAAAQVWVRLCTPAGPAPEALQVLVPGITYNHRYWDIPDPAGNGSRYSYVRRAAEAGHATLSFDPLGTGASSHPPSVVLTFETYADIAHQIVQAARAGTLPGQSAGFERIVLVGHSLGSVVAWLEASTYQDVDGLISTGATHDVRLDKFSTLALKLGPAALDPAFAGRVLDPGYLTTLPGQRAAAFYDPGAYDPAVAAWDESNKDLGSYPALAEAPLKLLATPLDIRVPTLVVVGEKDEFLCGDPLGLQGADCSSDAALAASEAPHLGSQVPSVDGYVLRGAGHDINAMTGAPAWFSIAQSWIDSRIEDQP